MWGGLCYCNSFTVADPGFPRGGGTNSPGGAPTYDFAKFSRKLHEIERIWIPGGGGMRPKFYYVDPPQLQYLHYQPTCHTQPMTRLFK